MNTPFKRGSQYHDAKVVCPHCGHSYRPEAADYSDHPRVEECDKCGKEYELWDEFSVTHHTRPLE